jgi:hypothetical protein
MEVCEGHVYEGVKVSMGMDDSEVIEYAGLKWVIAWPIGFVVLSHECVGQGKIIGTEVIWVMIA